MKDEKDNKTKTITARETLPIKLKLNKDQKKKFRKFIFNFKVAINEVLRITYEEIMPKMTILEKPINGYCALSTNTKSDQKRKKQELDAIIDIAKWYDKNKKYAWSMDYPNDKIYINSKMLLKHYSLRKLFLPSKYRDTLFNMEDFSNIKNREINDSVLYKVDGIVKSNNTWKNTWKREMETEENKLSFWQEILDKGEDRISSKGNKLYEINFKSGNKKIFREKQIKRYIEKANSAVNRKKQNLEKTPLYKANLAQIYAKLFDIGYDEKGIFFNFEKDLLNFGKLYIIGKHQKKIMNKRVKNLKKRDSEILYNNKGYFFQYILSKDIDIKLPDKTYNVIGVDLGILKPIVYSMLDYNGNIKKVGFIKFKGINGKQIRSYRLHKLLKRRRYGMKNVQKIKKRLARVGKKLETKFVSTKWYKDKCGHKERNYVKYMSHLYSTKFIEEIKKIPKAVIVLEDLKFCRDDYNVLHTVTQNCPSWMKRIKGQINSWEYNQLHNFIQYKANKLGIAVVRKGFGKCSSITCLKCGHINPENRVDKKKGFICVKCGYSADDDYVASVNIAIQFMDKMKNKDYELYLTNKGEVKFKRVTTK